MLDPLIASSALLFALAVTERPWPPKGIGSQKIDAIGIAMIGCEGHAYLTPVLTSHHHATNLGLVGAVTKQLLEAMVERDVAYAGYLVRQGEIALERALEQSGFQKTKFLSATEHADYLEFSAPPRKVLASLSLDNVRVGDLLNAALDGQELDRLSAYHFALTVGLGSYLRDSVRYVALLPGLIELIADLPPGGVPPGTPGPGDIIEPGPVFRER